MCVILYLKAGYTLPKDLLFNAAHNNPDGWGLIIKKDGQLRVTKDLPKDGNDPEVIYKMLKDNEDSERFLHVRHKTAGDISIENTQPFKVYDDRGREIWFMHNGTLSGYTPAYSHWNHQTNQRMTDPNDKKSDSLKFAETVLTKYLPKLIGDNGVADYHDPVAQEILSAKWSGTNRGILVCNDLEPIYFGETHWETIKTSELIDGKEVTGEFFASNNDYFERLKRGPLFDKLEEARKKKEEEDRKKREKEEVKNSKVGELESLSFLTKYSLSEGIVDTLEDYNIFQRDGFIQLANLTWYEWLAFVTKQSPDDVATMFLYLTDHLKTTDEELSLAEGRVSDLEKGLKNKKEGESDDAKAA